MSYDMFDWQSRPAEDTKVMGVVVHDFLMNISNVIGEHKMNMLLSQFSLPNSDKISEITGVDKDQVELILCDFIASGYIRDKERIV